MKVNIPCKLLSFLIGIAIFAFIWLVCGFIAYRIYHQLALLCVGVRACLAVLVLAFNAVNDRYKDIEKEERDRQRNQQEKELDAERLRNCLYLESWIKDSCVLDLEENI